MTDRGLRAFPPIGGIVSGYISCQESSLAAEPAIWVTVCGFNGTSMAGVQIGLTDAYKLANALRDLADNHYQIRTT